MGDKRGDSNDQTWERERGNPGAFRKSLLQSIFDLLYPMVVAAIGVVVLDQAFDLQLGQQISPELHSMFSQMVRKLLHLLPG